MRQTLPHRNIIHSGLMKCKVFVRCARDSAGSATFLPQHFWRADMSAGKIRMSNNGLGVSFLQARFFPPQTDMAGMCLWHDDGAGSTRAKGRRT